MLPDRMVPYWDSENNTLSVENAYPKSTRPSQWIDPVCGYRWTQRVGALTTMFDRTDRGLRTSVCPACEGNILIAGRTDLGTTHPHLAPLWHPDNEVKITEVSKGSRDIVLWKCSEGHEWKRKIKDQTVVGAVCMPCKRATTKPAKRSLLKDSEPEIFKEAIRVVSGDKTIESIARASSLMVEWKCSGGHTYEARVSNRTLLNRGCPYCAGRMPIAGETDIATTNPEVMKYWDYDKNFLRPEEVAKSHFKKLHWVCEKDHHWEAIPETLTIRGQYCPYCSGKWLIPGETDFATQCPDKVIFWDYEKNPLKPDEISAGNGKRVFWKCPLGHGWEAAIYTVALSADKSCPTCQGRRGLRGTISTLYPELLAEWDYEKNDIKPEDCTFAAKRRVWWKCKQGHSWDTPVHKRTTKKPSGCPECVTRISQAEEAIAEYIKSLLISETVLTSHRKLLAGKELDIYVPEKKIAIEYNGIYWHSEAVRGDTTYHYNKWKACKDKGIELIQIWEDDWNRNPELVKRLLARKLGVSNERTVVAENTSVVELAEAEANPFLEENHIQGYTTGSYYLGLRDSDTEELVSVLVLEEEIADGETTFNIVRYATSANVAGGFAKLLNHAEELYSPDSFAALSDHCMSDDDLYENNGFTAVEELSPDHMYVIGNTRQPKQSYPLERFKDDPALHWEDGLTEQELADLNELKRIWDAGKTRWVSM